ncbi:16S rRNA (cytosine(967)-C(5))-methyltransferase RsmB [Pectinatus brassicae]|uniref:16S rRNA (cytosine(967)-C(5))-methyltransferase n=1 Tax=Pectinatus brassicae TaxID=862415 RepID=A0A840USP2_9FIRM|nr:16S rRNA (cytosine(967)-C(5))-methyltransferase RsmB [Pectinatus brassicae]MBB5335535.1 16S rRNA (cytosine967-C5)-methyltransferase [Pectinatus brassicae]
MNARRAALQILREVYDKNAYANIVLNKYFKKNDIEEIDRRFITELVYGSIKAGDTLLWILRQYIKMPVKKVHPVIRDILRLGIYQLFYMDKVPESAVCNEAVKLAKKYGHPGTVKFVNAVLRNIVRDKSKADFAKAGENTAQYIALKYWHPLWLVELFIKEFGVEQAALLCEFNNTDAPICFRCNTLKNTVDELQEFLIAKNAQCHKSELCAEALICTKHPALSQLEVLDDGRALIQDESSMLVARVVDPQPDELIIDMCSAPGGKATHMAMLMDNTGKVIANDIYEHKLELIRENAQKLGLTNIKTNMADARFMADKYIGKADKVLADVPCSGMGVLRRKADSRWNKTPEELNELPQLQYEILCSAAKAVKTNGIVVYSTCTVLKQENDDVVNRFLDEHTEFILDDVEAFLPEKLRGRGSKTLQLLPHRDNTDGFFIARIKKIK